MWNRLVYRIKFHQQIQWKHARAVKQQRPPGFVRSYLQPGRRERNTAKEWESSPGVLSGRRGPPSWLMFFFFFFTLQLCAVDTRVFLRLQLQSVWTPRLKSSVTRTERLLPPPPGCECVREKSETLPGKYHLRSKEYINEVKKTSKNSSNSPKILSLLI